MAISHCFRLAGNLYVNGSAKTLAFVYGRHCRYFSRFDTDTLIFRGNRVSWSHV